jgi:hypothetical protein
MSVSGNCALACHDVGVVENNPFITEDTAEAEQNKVDRMTHEITIRVLSPRHRAGNARR